MDENIRLENRLIGLIERSLYEGGGQFTKRYILGGTEGNIPIAASCIRKWASEGKLVILRPFEDAEIDEDVVRMLSYISKPIPWP